MRGLTIAQPYPTLICLPDSDPRWKGVENRNWGTAYRGDLLIHAGLSRKWLKPDACGTREAEFGLAIGGMAFGAAVAVARLADCVRTHFHFKPGAGPPPGIWSDASEFGAFGLLRSDADRRPWLASHRHATGPYLWILEDVRPLPAPIPWRGSQGIWVVPEELAAKVREQLSPAESRS